jgi:hypothetical protein
MYTLGLILGIILLIIIIVGLVRVLTRPYTGFDNLLLEMMLVDWLFDGIESIVSMFSDSWE